MALWGISTTTETAANNYGIPKHLSENDRNNTPWNCFADVRGWIYRRYSTNEYSGLSTTYYDEVLVPIVGLNSQGQGGDAGSTGLGTAGPVAVFFEDPNRSSRISIGGGGTTGVSTNTTAYVHVVFNELVFAGAGATVRIRTFDANNANESTAIVGTAASSGSTQYAWASTAALHGSPDVFENYNGQITNRVSFAFTSPSTVLSANVAISTTLTTTGQTVAIGGTNIFVDSVTGVSIGSSLTVAGKLTNVPIISVGSTSVQIGTASTIATTITAGLGVTFSTFTRATKLFIDIPSGFIGVVTDGSNGVGVISSFTAQFGDTLLRNVGGAGTTGLVGIGTTTLTVA
tara:strand:- start:2711 stop:3745 length:1035 start_codon:yes stop_codon:yes gene_type:complete